MSRPTVVRKALDFSFVFLALLCLVVSRASDVSTPYDSMDSSTAAEPPVAYRYRGPPQVKMETWKPGRPRSEVIDYSRSSSFNVPEAKKEKQRLKQTSASVDLGLRPALDEEEDVPQEAVEEKVVARVKEVEKAGTPITPAALTTAATTIDVSIATAAANEVAARPEKEGAVCVSEGATVEAGKVSAPPQEEEPVVDVREKIGNLEKMANTGEKPVVMRKSSFLTARPFEPRPVSMPIKRPNFAPSVIQPVPFVSRKIRAPEVRGFASLPPVDITDSSSAAAKLPAGPTSPPPTAIKPRLTTQTSKENGTDVIRNKLIQSARRPSAELDGSAVKQDDKVRLFLVQLNTSYKIQSIFS